MDEGKQFVLVIDHVPGPSGSWDAHLADEPYMSWSSSDVHTLLAAIGRDLAQKEGAANG